VLALPLGAQTTSNDPDDFQFDPTYTQAEFAQLSRIVAQAIYASPVEPARARGVFGFDVGVAAVAVPVDENSLYWRRAVPNDFTTSGYLVVPRLTASKGFVLGTISGSYAKVPDSDIAVYGGALDVPILQGGVATPTIAVRGAYSMLRGTEDVYDLKTYGVEGFISKGFGPITPYAGIGRMRIDASGNRQVLGTILESREDLNRYTVGVRISLLLPKIVLEATQVEDERSYAAKVSFGL
jgi:hypothetical protein